MNRTSSSKFSVQWAVGVAFIVIGTLFLLMNIGVIDSFPVWKFWPVILIILGIARMMQPFNRASGFWLFAIGAWVQVNFLRLWDLGFGDTWPFLLVALGIFWIWSSLEKQKVQKHVEESVNQSSSQSS